MDYSSELLWSRSNKLFSAARFVWPVLLLVGISLSFATASLLLREGSDAPSFLVTLAAIIPFLVAVLTAFITVALLQMRALEGLRLAELDSKEPARSSLTTSRAVLTSPE